MIEEESAASTPGASDGDAPGPSAEPVDTVRLWEEGYADRYYEQKFKVDAKDVEFRHKVAQAYVEGLCWVLEYYSQGCPSWEWYYPYHYAPFAADFVDMGKMKIDFQKGRISRPFEQLMSVLPAASRASIPEVYHELMLREDSEIIDFYPEEFEIDLNGKKMAWQGVALLPFIDMPRLLNAMATKDHLLADADRIRNGLGKNYVIISDAHPGLYDQITSKFYSKKQGVTTFTLDPKLSDGLTGTVEKMENYIPHGELVYPLERATFPSVEYDRSLTVYYEFPPMKSHHKSVLLHGAKPPPAVLDRSDIELLKSKSNKSGRSYGGVPFGGNNRGGYNGNRGGMINYGPGQGGQNRQGGRDSYQSHGNGYGNGQPPRNSYQQPPANWIPPPPGMAGFGSGPPPPPPGYGGHNQGYGNNRYAMPGPPPPQHGGHQGGYQGGYQGQGHQGGYQGGHQGGYQSGPPGQQHGQGRQYDNRGGQRDNRGYRGGGGGDRRGRY